MIEKYESLASDLLEWIEQTIIILNNRKFANSLVGVQQQLQAFNTYRTVEKPPKWVSIGEHFIFVPYIWAILFVFNMILFHILRSPVPNITIVKDVKSTDQYLSSKGVFTLGPFQCSKYQRWSESQRWFLCGSFSAPLDLCIVKKSLRPIHILLYRYFAVQL